MSLNGMDVSAFQPASITKMVGYDFVFIKATQGTTYVSSACDAQYQAAVKEKKLVGVYHFANGGDANAEADFFVKNIQGYLGKAVLVLDLEAGALSRGAGWAKAWLDRVTAKTGIRPLIYGSRGNICNAGYSQVAGSYGLWVAAYPDNSPGGYKPQSNPGNVSPWPSAWCYQYEDLGRLAGYAGNLDLDVFYGTAAQWAALAAKGATIKPPAAGTGAPPAPRPSSVGYNMTTRPTSQIQKLVGATPDGVYGPDTTAKVKAWQAAHKLTVDGIWGPKSDAAGFPKAAKPIPAKPVAVKTPKAPKFPLPKGSFFGPESGPATSVSGYHGHAADLQVWQNRMRARGWAITADGKYGPETAGVAHAFQVEKHLTADSLIGPATWAAAWTAPIT